MPKPMKESEAWRIVARRIEKARQMPCGFGLCDEMFRLLYGDMTYWSYSEARAMSYTNPRIAVHIGRKDYAYQPGTEWEARCLAAYWLALEAEEEGK
jgi:hypothetical protein